MMWSVLYSLGASFLEGILQGLFFTGFAYGVLFAISAIGYFKSVK